MTKLSKRIREHADRHTSRGARVPAVDLRLFANEVALLEAQNTKLLRVSREMADFIEETSFENPLSDDAVEILESERLKNN